MQQACSSYIYIVLQAIGFGVESFEAATRLLCSSLLLQLEEADAVSVAELGVETDVVVQILRRAPVQQQPVGDEENGDVNQQYQNVFQFRITRLKKTEKSCL